ncbi:MAG: DUF2703 domain-containing protein [bacterium]|nr:DUF2703 domain-containing protein [bacterium]
MKTLKIRWQRLISNGQTCPRCKSTEEELERAVSILEQSLTPLGIQVILEKEELSIEEFEKDTLQSNRIWINGRLLEEWIGGKVSQSQCCDICGPSECRTIEIEEESCEVIPAELIIRAGLLVASQLIENISESCCECEVSGSFTTNCCQKQSSP